MFYFALIGIVLAAALLFAARWLAIKQHRTRQHRDLAAGQPITCLLKPFQVSKGVVIPAALVSGLVSAVAADGWFKWLEGREEATGTLSAAVSTALVAAILCGLAIGFLVLPLFSVPTLRSKD